jgi:hypothetical protein
MREIAIVLTARASFAKYETILEHLTDVPTRIYACGGALLARYGGVVDVVRRRFPEIPITEVYSQYEGSTSLSLLNLLVRLVTELALISTRIRPVLLLLWPIDMRSWQPLKLLRISIFLWPMYRVENGRVVLMIAVATPLATWRLIITWPHRVPDSGSTT